MQLKNSFPFALLSIFKYLLEVAKVFIHSQQKIIQYLPVIVLIATLFGCSLGSTQRTNISELNSLRDSIEQQIYKDVNAIVVYQKGKLVVEEYYNGTSKNDIHDARSIGKSIASALLGIAIDEGYIESLDQSISDFYDLEDYENYPKQKREIKLRDLVTMTSDTTLK